MRTPMMPVTRISASVEFTFAGKRLRVPVEQEPVGLEIEPGIEDV